jgi:hypothetical protein
MPLVPFNEIFSIENDEDFARRIFEGFWPSDGRRLKNQALFERVIDPVSEFEFAMACNGFSSLFDQSVDPYCWPEIEAFFERVEATKFAVLLGRARRIYFGGEDLPSSKPIGGDFQSKIWLDPEGLESKEFDRVATDAYDAFYSDAAISKIGSYLRCHWDEIY